MGYVELIVPMEYEPQHYVNAWDGDTIKTVYGEDVDEVADQDIFWIDPRSEEGELACPQRFPARIVEELKRDKGPYAYAGQYQQTPEPRGGAIIRREFWQIWNEEKFPPFEFIGAYLDTAYTEDRENDYCAMSILGVFRDEHKNPRIMLVFAWRDRLQLHDLVIRVIDTCTVDKRVVNHPRFPVDRLIVENKAAGISAVQEIRRIVGFNDRFGIEYFDPRKYGDKVARAHSVQHLFAEGLIYAPDRQFADMVINECAVFPKGSHDDLCDTITMGCRHLRDNGLLLRREEQAEIDAAEVAYQPRSLPLYPA
jgi:predicted phage terminase large subunit-like protein